MKKILLIFLTLLLVAALAACGSAGENTAATDTAETAASGTETESTETADTSSEAGCGVITVLEADGNNTELSEGSAEVTIGNKTVTLNGAYVVDGTDAVINGGTYYTDAGDTNVFLVINGGSLTISNAEITKAGDAGTNESTRTSDVSDDYNFYGINSVILVVGEESSATITNCIVNSDCSGANAIFSTDGAAVTAENVQIDTAGDSSRGVYATYEGSIEASHLTITTAGAHCAPIATDRGGGYVTVKDSLLSCSGDGSPCIYSTGEIKVENVVGTSTGAQAAVIEGKNSIEMTGCEFTVSGGNNGIMLYQSMSGDAADSDATSEVSTLTMADTTINVTNGGPLFYVTNTSTVVNLNGGNTLTADSGIFAYAAAGRWGNEGSNGGDLTLDLNGDSVADTLETDSLGSITVNTSEGSSVTGETSGDVTVN